MGAGTGPSESEQDLNDNNKIGKKGERKRRRGLKLHSEKLQLGVNCGGYESSQQKCRKVPEVKKSQENPVTCGWSEEAPRGTQRRRAGGAVVDHHEDLSDQVLSDQDFGDHQDDDLVGVVVGRVFGDVGGGGGKFGGRRILRRWSGHAALPRG